VNVAAARRPAGRAAPGTPAGRGALVVAVALLLAACGGGASGEAENPSRSVVEVPGLFVEVSAGSRHTCGLRADAAVVCWGDKSEGQLDAPPGRYRSVSAGAYFTCALREDAAVACWGDNSHGQSDPPAGRYTQGVNGPSLRISPSDSTSAGSESKKRSALRQ